MMATEEYLPNDEYTRIADQCWLEENICLMMATGEKLLNESHRRVTV